MVANPPAHMPEEPPSLSLSEMWQVNKYLWLSLAIALAYLLNAQVWGLLQAPAPVAWTVFGFALADAASRSWIAYRSGGYLPGHLARLYTALDVLLISIAVGITRGVASELWLLYFVVMIFEALHATPQQKRRMDLMIAGAYLLATLSCQVRQPPPMPYPAYWATVGMRLCMLVLVGAIARRVSANIRTRNREIALLRAQQAVAEERARIAREIHDGLGHALVSGIVRLELCRRLMRHAPEEAETILEEEVRALRTAWSEGRDLAFHLRPWETTDDDVVAALRRHVESFATRTGLAAQLSAESGTLRLRPHVAFGLVRIVQEALTNVARHAQATQVHVILSVLPDRRVQCQIRDNGRGFIQDTASGMGLQAMHERAEELGGTCVVQSVPGGGTEVIVTLPMPEMPVDAP
ncbi:MAG: sensor histidine kinase [Chthonomonadaceae bacterium]|nr:sensor histidine kinase [Chthonomonadaceae bacterium]